MEKRPTRFSHQWDNEALCQLQQVAPQNSALHLRRPLPLDALQKYKQVLLPVGVIMLATPVLPAVHLEQPLD